MQELNTSKSFGYHGKSNFGLLPALIVWMIVFFAGIIFFISESEENDALSQYFLIPWVVLVAVIVSFPLLYYWLRNEFKIYNPIIYAACSYFFPSFVLGGFILANRWSQPYFLGLIQDIKTDLPFTMIIIALGFGGLMIGFMIPIGRVFGKKIGDLLPIGEWNPDNLFSACYFLLFIGLVNTVIGYVSGILGYQKQDGIGIFDGILYLMTLVWMEATFLLWLVIFRRNKIDFKAVFSVILILFFSLVKALYAGNRGGLFSIFMVVMLAYFLSGRKLTVKQGVLGGCLLFATLIVGMIYGTTFRNLKETESRIGMEQYTENIFATFQSVIETDNLKNLEQGFSNLSERLDGVSSLAVVVSNYEILAPYEEGYGLDNNIWKDTATFFIPRIVWQDKPLASEPRKYSELYFKYGENSFIVTPMGDLLRNFGVSGVVIGMLLLGILLRLIYAALIEKREFSYWRVVLYFMLLTSISYENFYGTIIPFMTKVGFVSLLGIFIVNFIVNKNIKLKI